MNLYELSENYNAVQDLIEMGDECLEDTLNSLSEAIENKANNYGKIIKNIESNCEVLKNEIDRLTKKKKSYENSIKILKNNLEHHMKKTDKRKIKTVLFSFNIQKKPPSVEIINPKIIPSMYYIKQEPKLDKRTLLLELRNGAKIDGVKLKQGEGLRIR